MPRVFFFWSLFFLFVAILCILRIGNILTKSNDIYFVSALLMSLSGLLTSVQFIRNNMVKLNQLVLTFVLLYFSLYLGFGVDSIGFGQPDQGLVSLALICLSPVLSRLRDSRGSRTVLQLKPPMISVCLLHTWASLLF